ELRRLPGAGARRVAAPGDVPRGALARRAGGAGAELRAGRARFDEFGGDAWASVRGEDGSVDALARSLLTDLGALRAGQRDHRGRDDRHGAGHPRSRSAASAARTRALEKMQGRGCDPSEWWERAAGRATLVRGSRNRAGEHEG